jgi:hypothetical protein
MGLLPGVLFREPLALPGVEWKLYEIGFPMPPSHQIPGRAGGYGTRHPYPLRLRGAVNAWRREESSR